MSTIIPSPLAGLADALGFGLQLGERRKARESQEKLQQQQLDMQSQAQALQRLQTFLPLLPGKKLADVPFIHEDFRSVFGAEPTDVSPTGAGSFVFTPESIEQVAAPLIIDRIEQLRAQGDEGFEGLLDASVAKAFTDQATSPEQRDVTKSMFELQRNALNSVVSSPDIMEGVFRNMTGLPQTVSYQMPNGETIEYGSPEEARFAVDMFRVLSDNKYRELNLSGASRDQMLNMADSLMTNFNEIAPEGNKISKGIALRIVNAYGDPQKLEAMLDAEAERKRSQNIPETQVTPTEAALKFLDHGYKGAQGGLTALAEQYPEIAPLVEGVNTYTEILAGMEGLSVEERERLSENFLTTIQKVSGGVPGLPDPRRRFAPDRTEFKELTDQSQALINERIPDVSAGGPAGPTGLAPGPSGMLRTGQDAQAVGASAARQAAMDAAARLATGQTTVADLAKEFGNNTALLRAIVQTAEMLRQQQGGR